MDILRRLSFRLVNLLDTSIHYVQVAPTGWSSRPRASGAIL